MDHLEDPPAFVLLLDRLRRARVGYAVDAAERRVLFDLVRSLDGVPLATTTPAMQLGDPSQSQATPVEQYRKRYVFLAPNDYVENFIDVVQPMGASLTLDGTPAVPALTNIGSGFGVARLQLGPGNGGAHVLESDQCVGLQVIGYGLQTSYQYPGGLNLEVIAEPPPPPK